MSEHNAFDRLTVKRKLFVLIGAFCVMWLFFGVFLTSFLDVHSVSDLFLSPRLRPLTALEIGMLAVVVLGFGYILITSISRTLDETVNALSSTSAEIASAIQQHERTAMTQAAAVNETTTTMDELDASAKLGS